MKFNLVQEIEGNIKTNINVEMTLEELSSSLLHNREVLKEVFENSYKIKDLIKSAIQGYKELITPQPILEQEIEGEE